MISVGVANDRLSYVSWQPEETEFLYFRTADDDAMMRRPLLDSVAAHHTGLSDRVDTEL